MRKESETPSGIRLMLLLKGHLREIMNRECANQTSIHLYCTGSYWVAFERSAYQLRRAFRIVRSRRCACTLILFRLSWFP